METSYTIYKKDYWQDKYQYSFIGKRIEANYMSYFQLPCILQV